MRRAIFLDRDGTLVRARHYPSKPEELELYEGVAQELLVLQSAGFALVVVTNQSGIARGLFTHEDLQRMHEALQMELAACGVTIDGFYHCPHHPDGIIPELSMACDCRKPQPGMLHMASRDLDIDLRKSWFVGDILDDVEAGKRAGCRTILVDLGTETWSQDPIRQPDFMAVDTVQALRVVEALEGLASEVDLSYTPARWESGLAAPDPAGEALAHAR